MSVTPDIARASIESADGHIVEALVQPAPVTHPSCGQSVVLLTPAMGVGARYYRRLVLAFAERGHHVVAPEMRGSAGSSQRVRRGVDFGYRELLDFDWPAAEAYARRRFPGARLVMVGHSLGGQLNCLHQARLHPPQRAAAQVMLACCSAHHAGYPRRRMVEVLGGSQLAAALATVLGRFPGHRLGFGGHQPVRLMRDWARDARLGRFVIAGDGRDYRQLLSQLDIPTLAVSFDGDQLAPASAVDALCARLRPGAVDRMHIAPADLGLRRVDHFSWVGAAAAVAERVDRWLATLSARG